MKAVKFILLAMFLGLMIYGAADMPHRLEAEQRRAHSRGDETKINAGSYYISHAYEHAKTPNMVTVVLADYRSVDTLGEQVVIYTAGLITLLILRRRRTA